MCHKMNKSSKKAFQELERNWCIDIVDCITRKGIYRAIPINLARAFKILIDAGHLEMIWTVLLQIEANPIPKGSINLLKTVATKVKEKEKPIADDTPKQSFNSGSEDYTKGIANHDPLMIDDTTEDDEDEFFEEGEGDDEEDDEEYFEADDEEDSESKLEYDEKGIPTAESIRNIPITTKITVPDED